MSENFLIKIASALGSLLPSEPGDTFEARVTDNDRQVIKASKNGGADKYSATKYPNGTIVETRTRKPR